MRRGGEEEGRRGVRFGSDEQFGCIRPQMGSSGHHLSAALDFGFSGSDQNRIGGVRAEL